MELRALGTLGCIAALTSDNGSVRRTLDRLRSLPTRGGGAELQQARIMAAAGNRDAMMRLLVAAASHGYQGGDLMPIEFLPYQDYPPFREFIFPSN